MKVLVVIDSLGFGGAERLLVTLLPEMKRNRIDCDVVVLMSPYSLATELQEAGIRVVPLGIAHRWFIPEALFKLFRIIWQGKYDAVWGHLFFGNMYAMLSGILAGIDNRVMTLHSRGYAENMPTKLWQKIRLRIEKFIGYHCPSKIIAVSNATARDYQISFGWDQIGVVHNAIPVNLLPPLIDSDQRIEIRQRFGVREDAFLMVTAARYVGDKGHSVMLDALVKFRGLHGWCPHWIAAGHGPLKPELEHKSKILKLADSVLFLDSLPQIKLFSLIQSADVFVLPSLSEPFGIAAGEALALGVPCILSDVGGLCELAGVGDAAVAKMVKPNDPLALCNAIWGVYSDVATREKRVREGKLRISKIFSTTAIVKKWCTIFKTP